jgi:glycosyltransferase involved in cell wall biosynthesis
VGPQGRDEIFRNARASLHLTTIPERFGLAMAESMACGTPVIGFDRGSVREVVANGQTGFVVEDLSQAILALERIGEIDRRACRERVERLFSVDAMVDGYLDAYHTVLGDRFREPSAL